LKLLFAKAAFIIDCKIVANALVEYQITKKHKLPSTFSLTTPTLLRIAIADHKTGFKTGQKPKTENRPSIAGKKFCRIAID